MLKWSIEKNVARYTHQNAYQINEYVRVRELEWLKTLPVVQTDSDGVYVTSLAGSSTRWRRKLEMPVVQWDKWTVLSMSNSGRKPIWACVEYISDIGDY